MVAHGRSGKVKSLIAEVGCLVGHTDEVAYLARYVPLFLLMAEIKVPQANFLAKTTSARIHFENES